MKILTADEQKLKDTLCETLDARERVIANLSKRGLLTHKSWGLDVSDRIAVEDLRKVDGPYWQALSACEDAGIVKTHNRSFSWL